MITIVSLLSLFLSISIAFFVSRKLSPIPYFPSNKKDINKIVLSLQLANDQVVYDLGAGDGVVIFAAATEAHRKKLNIKFIAIEINPILIAVIWLRLLIHPNRKNIKVMYGDIFSIRYTKYDVPYTKTTFFAYISPWFLSKVFKNCKLQFSNLPAGRHGFKFVSYFYPIPNLTSSRTIKGVHPTYVYSS